MIKSFRRVMFAGTLGVAMLAVSAAPAHATTIIGRYNFTLGNVKVTFGFVDWTTDPGAVQSPPPVSGVVSYGTFDVATAAPTRTGVFSGPEFGALGLGAGGTGLPALPESIQDMTDPGLWPGDARNVPVGNSAGIPNFFLIQEHPTWQFEETNLVAGTAGLPFTITPSGNDLSITMTINGLAWDTGTPLDKTPWTAVISAQYTNLTEAQLEAQVLAGTLPINSWSGTFEAFPAGVPEPATLTMFGLGSVIVAARKRRKANKSN